jgi:hypothetical protein
VMNIQMARNELVKKLAQQTGRVSSARRPNHCSTIELVARGILKELDKFSGRSCSSPIRCRNKVWRHAATFIVVCSVCFNILQLLDLPCMAIMLVLIRMIRN